MCYNWVEVSFAVFFQCSVFCFDDAVMYVFFMNEMYAFPCPRSRASAPDRNAF
jgi:hypothetical protein